MDARELARYYTLSEADLTAIGIRRGAANRLGFAIQLCLLRYPGRPLQVDQVIHRNIIEFVASQVGADPDAFYEYARERDTTRREHVAEITRTFSFRHFDAQAYRELSRWLLPIAEGTDSGEALVGALLEEMRRREILAPALYAVERLAWETRHRAQQRVFAKLVADLEDEQLERLDSLVVVPEGEDETPLNRLRRPPGPPSPKNFKDVLDRLNFMGPQHYRRAPKVPFSPRLGAHSTHRRLPLEPPGRCLRTATAAALLALQCPLHSNT